MGLNWRENICGSMKSSPAEACRQTPMDFRAIDHGELIANLNCARSWSCVSLIPSPFNRDQEATGKLDASNFKQRAQRAGRQALQIGPSRDS